MKATKRKNQKEAKEKTRLTQTLERMDEECRNCRPLTPLKCIENCNVWKFKNELRQLRGMMVQKDYPNTLLNTLKNKRRLRILEMLSKSAFSITQLQKELKKHEYNHSQKTIINEYVEPLIVTGLVACNSSRYKATTFGCEISQLFTGFHKIEDALPPHSECYEEKTIEALFESPKTCEELKFLISTESLSRVLERLQKANLMTKDDENSYVFYFKTKRNPQQERLSSTEKRVYENIPEEGITAEKLADKANISLRRTYKYLRKLRGKKLAFKRERPKTYALTTEGTQIAKLLQKVHALLTEFAQASAEFTTKPLDVIQHITVPDTHRNGREKPLQILVKSEVSQKTY